MFRDLFNEISQNLPLLLKGLQNRLSPTIKVHHGVFHAVGNNCVNLFLDVTEGLQLDWDFFIVKLY